MTAEDEKTGDGDGNWDKDRQFKDEIAAAGRREGVLAGKLEAAESQLAEAQKTASGDGTSENLDDYDQLKSVVVQLRDQLGASDEANKNLKERIEQFDQTSRNEEGKKQLQIEVAANEKIHGTTDYTNDVIKKVTDMFTDSELGLQDMKPAAKAEWIRTKLREEYRVASENAKPKNKSSDASVSNVDTGTGGAADVSDGPIKPGTKKEVAAAMLARDRKMAAKN